MMAGIPATETGVPDSEATTTNASTAWNKPCAEKWTGGVHLVLNCNLDAAWSLLSDFMGLPKWAPTITVSRLVEGEANAVGCVRFCKGGSTTWVHERLLELDEAKHYMSYRMEENHFVFPQGFQGYVAKVQLGEAGEGQTSVNWTYEVDPVISVSREDLTQFMIKFYSDNLKFLEDGANKLVAANSEAARSSTPSRPNVLPAQTAQVQAA